jgi:hypothetical protein
MADLNLKPRRDPDIAWRSYGDKTVILQLGSPTPESRQFHELDETASLLWNLSDGTRDIAAIASALLESYEISESDAVQDTETFLTELAEKGLITWNSEIPSP